VAILGIVWLFCFHPGRVGRCLVFVGRCFGGLSITDVAFSFSWCIMFVCIVSSNGLSSFVSDFVQPAEILFSEL